MTSRSRTARAIALALLLALLLLCLFACAPRGRYISSLGDSYTFTRTGRYTHTDAYGVKTSGKYQINGGEITLTPKSGDPHSLPYSRKGDALTIGGITYEKQ